MKEEQTSIYYASGESVDKIDLLPQVEILKDKGYEKTNDDSSLISLIADEVIERGEYAARLLLSIFPVANLYPFIQIITKKLDKEYNTILNSLDNRELLDSLEESRYIYNQNTILKGKENIISKIDEMSKADEANKNTNKHIEISENDSLEQLKQKEVLLNEMIYLKSLEEMTQVVSYQKCEENLEQNEKGKPLRLIRKFNQNQKSDE